MFEPLSVGSSTLPKPCLPKDRQMKRGRDPDPAVVLCLSPSGLGHPEAVERECVLGWPATSGFVPDRSARGHLSSGQLTLDTPTFDGSESQDLLFGHREGVGGLSVGPSPLNELILGIALDVRAAFAMDYPGHLAIIAQATGAAPRMSSGSQESGESP